MQDAHSLLEEAADEGKEAVAEAEKQLSPAAAEAGDSAGPGAEVLAAVHAAMQDDLGTAQARTAPTHYCYLDF